MGLKEIIIGILIWLSVFLIGVIPLTILFIWKVTVILIAKCIRRDLHHVSAADAMVVTGDGHISSIVNFGLTCRVEGEISLHDLQMKFSEKFLGRESEGNSLDQLQYERLHCSLVTFGSFAFFKRHNQIDINDQIYIKTLMENQHLEDLLSEWLLTKYRAGNPCWEIILIPMKAINQTVFAIKMHHAFADGYSMLYILDQLTGCSSPYLVKGFKETKLQMISELVQMPCHLGKLQRDRDENPFKCVKESQHRWSMTFRTLDLNLLKQIRRKHNVQFVSIILSLLGASLRRYLLESKKATKIPEHLIMAPTMPWPGHPSKISQSPTNSRICNHWSSAIIKVPIGELDPIQRLLAVDKDLVAFQSLGIHKFIHRILIPLFGLLPTPVIKLLLSNDEGFSAGYSTYVGGDNYEFNGHRISHIHPILAIHDCNPYVAISAFSFSHDNEYDLTISGNPQHFPDRESFHQIVDLYLPHELKRLSILSGIVNDDNK